MKLSRAFLALPFLALACSNGASEPAGTAAQEVSESWLATQLPPGSPAEAAVLALVNDPTMSMASYVSRCGFSESQAAALVSYRTGDEPASSSDDQTFDTLAEIDALPFTDAGFWTSAKACATGAPACIAPPVVIELVIDESGSMHGEKWDATVDATLALVDELSLSPNVSVGALRFSTTVGRRVAPKSLVSAGHRESLRNLVLDGGPQGGTETLIGLEAGYDALEHAPAAINAKRVLVLLSDGVPNGGATMQDDIVNLAGDKLGAQVVTHAIGIGPFPAQNPSMYNPTFMGRIAEAGGSSPAGCLPEATELANVCHHQITPGGGANQTKDAILDAYRAILPAAPPCP